MFTKKFSRAILCIILCIIASNIQAFAAGKGDTQSWYLKYYTDGRQPDTPDGGRYSTQYDVISLDRSGDRTIYLTFDAGYENGNVAKILDILKKHDVKGAFFILPNLIKSNPDIVQRMNDEGHLICNHTRSHGNMANIASCDEFKKELTDLEDILRTELGLEMAKYYRPPEGAYSEANLEFAKRLGYKTVFWSLAYADWDNGKQMSPDKAMKLLTSRVHPGCVMLLHPTSDTNALILDEFIVKMKADGYVFKGIDELPADTSKQECAI